VWAAKDVRARLSHLCPACIKLVFNQHERGGRYQRGGNADMNGEGRDITLEQHGDREEGGAGVDREMIDIRTRKINGLE
jgi:hypothetical protein